MKPENVWRAKLVRQFKATHRLGFIWPMDAKFKSGFPDLLVSNEGETFYYELKVVKSIPSINAGVKFSILNDYFDKIQISVMNSINKSGGRAYGLILIGGKDVVRYNPLDWSILMFSPNAFKSFWAGSHRLPGV